jgi:hypothetical protein
MIWYGQHNYPNLPLGDDGSLLVAMANLLRKHGRDINPAELLNALEGQPVSYASVTDYDPEMVLTSIGTYNTWPDTNDAIITFRVINEKGAATDHHCLLADPVNLTIIDSADGQVKSPGVYGRPTDWASYTLLPIDDQDLPPEVQSVSTAASSKNPHEYTLLRDESIWTVARRLNIPFKELIEHNDIKDPFTIGYGSTIRIPEVQAVEETYQPIRYEYLDPAQPMHVSRPGGAKKWYFGHVTGLKDLQSKGNYPEGYNVEVVAIAHIPIGDETAAFYMDRVAFGDKLTSGRVNYTMGFACNDMVPGYADKPIEKVAPVAERKLVEQALAPPPQPEPEKLYPSQFKATYHAFNQPWPHVLQGDYNVVDLDNKRPDVLIRDQKTVVLGGTFCKDQVFYGRPMAAVRGGSWYGIPMDNLEDYYELHNAPLDPEDQVDMHRKNRQLDLVDRRWQLISFLASRYSQFKKPL